MNNSKGLVTLVMAITGGALIIGNRIYEAGKKAGFMNCAMGVTSILLESLKGHEETEESGSTEKTEK